MAEKNGAGILILYEDDDLMVVQKPSGMVSESTERKDGLPDLLSVGGNPLFPIYRLDQLVSGVFLLAKTAKTAAALSAQIGEGADFHMEKEYRAIVQGRPSESSGEMFDLLYHDRKTNRSYVVRRKRNGVKSAELEYVVLASTDWEEGELTLVSVRLHTGRTHQIRVQFASRHLPIFGDRRYGGLRQGEIALYCREVRFRHPKTGEILCVQAPAPKSEPWTLFALQFDLDDQTEL